MTVDFLILGATGLQGCIITRDLLEKGYNLVLSDMTDEHMHKLPEEARNFPFISFDLEEEKTKLIEIIKESGTKIVINCAEEDFNLKIFEACIEAKTHCIDLGSYSEMVPKQLALDEEFKKNNLIAITGAGSAPGIVNVMLKHAAKKFDTIETIEAGFSWDSNMKTFVVPFSMEGIFYEFTKPTHSLENGEFIQQDPLNTLTTRSFTSIGKQTIMQVNHSEPFTFHKYFKHKGLKNVRFYAGFPQHSFEKIYMLIELGLHAQENVIVDAGEEGKPQIVKVWPETVVTEALRKRPIPEGYTEKENLWVDIYGTKDGKNQMIKMECLAPTLPGWEAAGCNIDTGLPASIMAQMLHNGTITTPGCHAPEAPGIIPEQEFFTELRKREMKVYENGQIINEVAKEIIV